VETAVISGPGITETVEITLLDQYTTGELLVNTEDALALFSDAFADEAIGVSDLSGDETSYSLQTAVIKIKHSASPSGYLKVWLKFEIEGGASGNFATYVWNQPEGPIDELAIIESSEYGLNPDLNTTVTVSIEKWSMLASYEPMSGDSNGFPGATLWGTVP
jgi:hypothetical protein